MYMYIKDCNLHLQYIVLTLILLSQVHCYSHTVCVLPSLP